MAKTAEEIRLEKMATDPNWAKNAQKQVAKVDEDFPELKTPQRKSGIGIGPPKVESKPKKNMDSAAMLGLGDNLIDRRDFEVKKALGEI